MYPMLKATAAWALLVALLSFIGACGSAEPSNAGLAEQPFAGNADFEADNIRDIGETAAVNGLKVAKPEWFGVNTTPGTTNMTAALQAAINAAPVVVLSAATYLADTLTLNSNTVIIGAGIDKTVIKQNRVGARGEGVLLALSSEDGAYLTNIRIANLTLDGQVATKGFEEQMHLAVFAGVDTALVERVKFLGFRGDGLILSAYPSGARHNKNIIVRSCIFDGINNDNRQGISIISGEGVLIQGNQFKNCTRANMPGAIDIEPDLAANIIRDIRIDLNTFYNTGGTSGSIGMYLQDLVYTTSPGGISITNNTITAGTAGDIGIRLVHAGDATDSRNHAITVSDNTVNGTYRGVVMRGLNQVDIVRNKVNETTASPLIGYKEAGAKNMNIRLEGNRFHKIQGGSGLSIYTVDYLRITQNTFVDCTGYCIDFGTGTSSYVSMLDNSFEDPTNVVTFAVQKEPDHTFTSATNQSFRNRLIDCSGFAFAAKDFGAIEN